MLISYNKNLFTAGCQVVEWAVVKIMIKRQAAARPSKELFSFISLGSINTYYLGLTGLVRQEVKARQKFFGPFMMLLHL